MFFVDSHADHSYDPCDDALGFYRPPCIIAAKPKKLAQLETRRRALHLSDALGVIRSRSPVRVHTMVDNCPRLITAVEQTLMTKNPGKTGL